MHKSSILLPMVVIAMTVFCLAPLQTGEAARGKDKRRTHVITSDQVELERTKLKSKIRAIEEAEFNAKTNFARREKSDKKIAELKDKLKLLDHNPKQYFYEN